MKTSPTPLRASPHVLEQWTYCVGVARRHLAERRASCPTVLVATTVLVAIEQEMEILRSQNDALRMMREEKE